MSVSEAQQFIGQAVEAVRTAREVMRLATAAQVEMPIIQQVYAVLYEGTTPRDAGHALLARETKPELP
jgi:glycerol-3-phosphate dehydrogenase (NAD(P)+)